MLSISCTMISLTSICMCNMLSITCTMISLTSICTCNSVLLFTFNYVLRILYPHAHMPSCHHGKMHFLFHSNWNWSYFVEYVFLFAVKIFHRQIFIVYVNLFTCSCMDHYLGKCFPKSHPYDDYGWDIHSYISLSYFYQKYNYQQ